MAQQLNFDLPVKSAHGREDFFVSTANAAAVAMIEQWRNWPGRKLVLVGPDGSGKTHLCHVWAAQSGALQVEASALVELRIADLAAQSVAVEACDAIAGNGEAEEALFHLHNMVLAEGHSLLLTGDTAPNFWPITLPDLASRLQGALLVTLSEPDDTLLTAVLAKQFHDRQIVPHTAVLPYLIQRIDRSFAAARAIVHALDDAALQEQRPITRALAKEVLDKLDA